LLELLVLELLEVAEFGFEGRGLLFLELAGK
jgi:hypothetical protein